MPFPFTLSLPSRLKGDTLRSLDYLPARWALLLGVAFGLLLGAGLALAVPVWLAVPGFVLLLAGAWGLALGGEPVMVLAPSGRSEPPGPPLPEMVEIPAGEFSMGSPDTEVGHGEDEGPVHEVRISAFACMRYPVTRRLYQTHMGSDPGWPEGEADERPVNNVSWFDAVAFCNRLSQAAGLTPCYRIEEVEEDRRVHWDHAADGYRLPTEAEWEYACRAGTTTPWSCGDSEKELERHAWFARNARDTTHPVGEKRPNPWGLYDMHGNVWEWCWDWYGDYSREPQTDPMGPPEGNSRMLRGGAFDSPAVFLRSAFRNRFGPENRYQGGGFRCVRGPRRQP